MLGKLNGLLDEIAAFEGKLDTLTNCAALLESELAATPVCPHCGFHPAHEQGNLLPAANVLRALDGELDKLQQGWRQALLGGGSPATPDDLRKRFEVFLNERCKGRDASKLRFAVE